MQTIYVSQGEKDFVGGTVTDNTGQDISGDTIVMALGPYATPPNRTDGKPPDMDKPGATTAQRIVKLLIDNSYAPQSGVYAWAWIDDNPTVKPLRLDGPFTIA